MATRGLEFMNSLGAGLARIPAESALERPLQTAGRSWGCRCSPLSTYDFQEGNPLRAAKKLHSPLWSATRKGGHPPWLSASSTLKQAAISKEDALLFFT